MARWPISTRRGAVATLVCALTSSVVHAQVGPPTEWMLYPHVPEPYCHDTAGVAEFRFASPQQARIQWQLLSPDSTAVMRTFMDGAGMAGLYTYFWDGRDDGGARVPDGRYPYTLVATDLSTQAVLFTGSQAITVRCVTGVEAPAWGTVKQLFR
jgi:hypothetical protein